MMGAAMPESVWRKRFLIPTKLSNRLDKWGEGWYNFVCEQRCKEAGGSPARARRRKQRCDFGRTSMADTPTARRDVIGEIREDAVRVL